MRTKSDYDKLDVNQKRAIQDLINGDDESLRQEIYRMEDTVAKLSKRLISEQQKWLLGMFEHYVRRHGILCCLASRVKQGLLEDIFNGTFYERENPTPKGTSKTEGILGTVKRGKVRNRESRNVEKGKRSNHQSNKSSRKRIPGSKTTRHS